MSNGMVIPVKNPELNRVQEESDDALKALDEIVNQLAERLSKAMSPSNPSAESEKQADPKYYSKLAQDIDTYNSSIWGAVYSIKSLLDRLEI